jgi:hypothetical protein
VLLQEAGSIGFFVATWVIIWGSHEAHPVQQKSQHLIFRRQKQIRAGGDKFHSADWIFNLPSGAIR